jgi:predicted porin
MKKSLLALAVSAAVAVPAFAQNVSIYGVFDQAVGQKETSSAGGATAGFGGVLTTNAIGFRGSEDLGGGLKAEFQFETEPKMFTQRDGNSPADSLATNGTAFLRVTGGFGTVSLGRFGALARNAGGTGSFIGNIGLSGNAGSVGNTGLITDARTRVSTRLLADFTDNAIAYTSPNVSGFTAQIYQSYVGSSTGFVGTSATTSVTAGDQFAVGATYVQGPLAVGVGHISREITATAKATTMALGANYDFGVARVGLSHNKFTENDSLAAATHKVTVAQASVPLDGGMALIGSYHFYKNDATATLNKGKGISVGLTKALSKRTTAYAVHAPVKNENNSAYSFGANDMVTVQVNGFDPSATWVGIRHSF